jgi:hypothetical protein
VLAARRQIYVGRAKDAESGERPAPAEAFFGILRLGF